MYTNDAVEKPGIYWKFRVFGARKQPTVGRLLIRAKEGNGKRIAFVRVTVVWQTIVDDLPMTDRVRFSSSE